MLAADRSRCPGSCWLVLAVLLACGGDEPREAGHVHDAGAEHEDAGHTETDGEAEAEYQGCPADLPDFELGMRARVLEGSIQASVVEASPAPPMRYLNDWTVELTDAEGNALEDVRIESARPFMPVHGHDGNLEPKVRGLSQAGRFAIADLNLFMRGPWEVQLRLRSASAGDGYVVFDVCIPE